MTAHDVSTSLRVCAASASSSSLVQRPPTLRFVAHDQQVDAERHQHDHEAGRRDVGHVAGAQPAERALQDLDHHQEQEHEDAGGGEGLVLAMAVGMVVVGRLARRAHGDDGHDVRRAVGQRVEAVRNDADRAGRVAERQLGDRDREVEREDAYEDAR